MGREHSWMDDSPPWDIKAFIYGLSGQDSGGADLIYDFSCLVEHESQDVLVVRDGDDGLKHQLAVADHYSTARAIVRVFPANSRILLMHTDTVWHLNSLALIVGHQTREVLNGSQTIASKLEIIRHDTCTNISKIEGCLLVVRMSWISIGNVHVRKAETIKETAVVVVDVVNDHSFSLVEADLEIELLPLDAAEAVLGSDLEAGTLWLGDMQRLEICS
jgi:hypothetical protein